MDLYHVVLFIHIAAAIVLVGGSAFAHVVVHVAKRTRTVEGLRVSVSLLHAINKLSLPLAIVVLVAGLYMAFAGNWWGAGWPVVSLVLFLAVGATAGSYLDPTVSRAKAILDEAPEGPIPTEVAAILGSRTLALVAWLFAGIDLSIVFLMTNKPGYLGSLAVAATGIALAVLVALRETRHTVAPAAPAAPPA